MVGIVLVSHSKKLAIALRELVLQMVGPEFPIAIAAGVGENFDELGTDAVHISEVLQPFIDGDGAVVLMDLGSAVLSAQTALELVEGDAALKLRLIPAPLVEAAVAAAVQANTGASLDDVAREAHSALAAKQAQLGEAEPAAPAVLAPAAPAGSSLEFEVVIQNPHGLHARPAATLVQAVSRFHSDVQLTNQTAKRGPSSARSLTSVSLLQARQGDTLRFTISGDDADATRQELERLAAARFGEAEEATAALPQTSAPRREGTPVGASEGIAIGRAIPIASALPLPQDPEPRSPNEEQSTLEAALTQVGHELRSEPAHGAIAEILAAQALILSDPVLLDAVKSRIAKEKIAAARAWREESNKLAASYGAMEDEYMRARATDVRDISVRVLRAMAGESSAARIQPTPPAILVTNELLPGEAMACDASSVLGVLASAGSATAHAAILMRTKGIPMVVGASSFDPASLTPETVLAMDGATGELWINPDAATLEQLHARQQAWLNARKAADASRRDPAITQDGVRIEVLANVGNVADAVQARENGAEGVGLLRSEFVYLSHREMPDELTQARSLAEVLAPLGEGPVVIRTPDVGADKPLPYLPSAEEHNPFLGVRGLRHSFVHPDFFRSNLRAILRSSLSHDLWIMFPMVTSPEEMQEARLFAEAAHSALAAEGVPHRWPVKLGMMVEVPAAALRAARFASLADFFSIGTNDLTQYILAAERGNAGVESLQDAAHPAVLRAIQQICSEAAPANCHVSVCGDAASDPIAAALMVGVGVRSLSVRPNQVGTIKAQMRAVSTESLRTLAEDAMRLDNAVEVRRFAAALLNKERE